MHGHRLDAFVGVHVVRLTKNYTFHLILSAAKKLDVQLQCVEVKTNRVVVEFFTRLNNLKLCLELDRDMFDKNTHDNAILELLQFEMQGVMKKEFTS